MMPDIKIGELAEVAAGVEGGSLIVSVVNYVIGKAIDAAFNEKLMDYVHKFAAALLT